MWQRFTQRARKAVFYASEEACRYGNAYASTEHLLLGLIREPDSLAARVLGKSGLSSDRILREVVAQIPILPPIKDEGQVVLTPRAKRVIDCAYDEARTLGVNYIGTEHLLLGIIREGDGIGGRILTNLGVNLEASRKVVMEFYAEVKAVEDITAEPVPDVHSMLVEVLKSLEEIKALLTTLKAE